MIFSFSKFEEVFGIFDFEVSESMGSMFEISMYGYCGYNLNPINELLYHLNLFKLYVNC